MTWFTGFRGHLGIVTYWTRIMPRAIRFLATQTDLLESQGNSERHYVDRHRRSEIVESDAYTS